MKNGYMIKQLKNLLTATFFLGLTGISAQSAHSSLKEFKQLESFQKISHKIMCTCGCNMPLYYCNHTGHCNAWPMRAALDYFLSQGKDENFIISGFIHGF